MKVVILAGGFGTRISEESHLKPKPMVEIGDHPILWHIMKIYSHYGFNDFVICLGYKGVIIKEYFENYFLYESDVTFRYTQMQKSIEYHSTFAEPWTVTLAGTGVNTMTGGRIKRIQKYIGDEPFLLTYGDGVSDVPIDQVVSCHKSSGRMVTMTAVKPTGRFGIIDIEQSGVVTSFIEKPQGESDWINGGFFVCQPEIFNCISGDNVNFEVEVLPELAKQKQLFAYKHSGFWGCMDTIRDMDMLNRMWKTNAPWKKWRDS